MKDKIKNAFSLHGDMAEHDDIKEQIISGSQVTGTNLSILMLAILIASIGLNMNSTAVVIGAMLISPLMGSIQAMAYGAAVGDTKMFKKSGIGLTFQIAICLLTSTIYFFISPISTETSELLARTQPNIWDVFIATCGGLAGMIGMTRKEKSNVIPGVAIATALMPPLCTCGYGIARGSIRIAAGAGYLFLVNVYFIFLSSMLVLFILRVPRTDEMSVKQKKRAKRRLVINTIVMIIPSIIVAAVMVKQANKDTESVTGFETAVSVKDVTNEMKILFPEVEDVKIGSMESVDDNGDICKETDVVVYLSTDMNAEASARLESWLDEKYDGDCNVIFIK